MRYWDKLFRNKKNNDNYNLAKTSLSSLKDKFNELIVIFPDVTISEMVFLKNQWLTLPEKLGKGVKILGVEMTDDYKLLITKFTKNSYLEAHEHNSNYELNKVLSGSVYDPINKKTYNCGDTFLMEKDVKHALSCTSEAYLLTLFTTNEMYLKFPDNISEKIVKFC